MQRDYIKFYLEWYEYSKTLSDVAFKQFFEAIILYGFERKKPKGLPKKAELYFNSQCLSRLEKDWQVWEQKAKRKGGAK